MQNGLFAGQGLSIQSWKKTIFAFALKEVFGTNSLASLTSQWSCISNVSFCLLCWNSVLYVGCKEKLSSSIARESLTAVAAILKDHIGRSWVQMNICLLYERLSERLNIINKILKNESVSVFLRCLVGRCQHTHETHFSKIVSKYTHSKKTPHVFLWLMWGKRKKSTNSVISYL